MKGIDLLQIFDSMKQNDINEVVIKDGSRLYEIRRGGFKHKFVTGGIAEQQASQAITQTAQAMPVNMQQQISSTQTSSVKNESTNESKGQDVSKSDLYEMKSPLVGTYYASPKPDAPHFVEVGSKIRKGQTLCIVEAMKNFNEIESEVDGIIKEICVKNEELIEYGKVLFKIELI